MPDSNTILLGRFYTCNDKQPWAEAAVIKNGRFVFVGDKIEAIHFDKNAKIIDFHDKFIMPGFIDGHTHAFGGKMSELYMAHLNDADSPDEYCAIIKKFIAAHPEYDVYLGMGWSNGMFENHMPNAAILDAIEADKPVIIQSGDWHAYWVNSAAMKAAHIDAQTPAPTGGKIERDVDGNPIGCLRETAMGLIVPIIPRLSLTQYKTAILAVQDMLLAYGDTAYMDMVLNFDESHEVFDAYAALDRENKLKMDVFGGYMIAPDDDPKTEIEKACALREACCFHKFRLTDIKIFVDGVVEGGTGFLLEPFETDVSYHGENRWSAPQGMQKLEKIVEYANRAGFSVHFHTVGDAAITVALDAIMAAQHAPNSKTNADARNALTHLQMATPDQMMRMKLQNVLAVVNPYWFYKESGYHEVERHYLGSRAEREYPLRSLLDAGVQISMASDYPITPDPNPLAGIQIGATRTNCSGDPSTLLNPTERATVHELIHAATLGAACQLKCESEMGSIEAGKKANLIILNRDITHCPLLDISKTHVLYTMLDGEMVYTHPEAQPIESFL